MEKQRRNSGKSCVISAGRRGYDTRAGVRDGGGDGSWKVGEVAVELPVIEIVKIKEV